MGIVSFECVKRLTITYGTYNVVNVLQRNREKRFVYRTSACIETIPYMVKRTQSTREDRLTKFALVGEYKTAKIKTAPMCFEDLC